MFLVGESNDENVLFVFPNLAYRGSGVSGNLYLKVTNLGRLIESEDFPAKRDVSPVVAGN